MLSQNKAVTNGQDPAQATAADAEQVVTPDGSGSDTGSAATQAASAPEDDDRRFKGVLNALTEERASKREILARTKQLEEELASIKPEYDAFTKAKPKLQELYNTAANAEREKAELAEALQLAAAELERLRADGTEVMAPEEILNRVQFKGLLNEMRHRPNQIKSEITQALSEYEQRRAEQERRAAEAARQREAERLKEAEFEKEWEQVRKLAPEFDENPTLREVAKQTFASSGTKPTDLFAPVVKRTSTRAATEKQVEQNTGTVKTQPATGAAKPAATGAVQIPPHVKGFEVFEYLRSQGLIQKRR